MGTEFGIGGADGPAVIESLDLFASGIDHGLDGYDQTGLQEEITAIGVHEVWYAWVFVHIETDAVADKVLYNSETGLFDERIHDFGDLKPSSMGLTILNSQVQEVPGGLDEAFGQWTDVSDHKCDGGIATIGIQADAEINAQDVPVKEWLIVGDSVDEDIIATGTNSGWEGVLAMGIGHAGKQGLSPGPAGHLDGQVVQLGSGNSRSGLAGQAIEDLDHQPTGLSHHG